jgi:formylglycine-generating enzyme required for sulfatase activity
MGHVGEMSLIPVPAGPFTMGTGAGEVDRLAGEFELAKTWAARGYFSREQPQHRVTLPAYLIGRHAVTVGQFRAFVEAGGYREQRYWTAAAWAWCEVTKRSRPDYWDDGTWAGDERLPVVGVSWYEAAAYCRWLGEATGRDFRLPTEAEWEKAARGSDGRIFPWGDRFDADRCNVRAGGLDRTVPVGRFSPAGDSPYGCAEMVGNVSEWTLTRYTPYPYDARDGRDDPAGGAERVTRGGSWHSPVLRARTSSRGMNDPFFVDSDLGFRYACSVGAV